MRNLHTVFHNVKVLVAQLCPTFCNPMDSFLHGILQARILEWVAIPFSRGPSRFRDQTQVPHSAGRYFTLWATDSYANLHSHQQHKGSLFSTSLLTLVIVFLIIAILTDVKWYLTMVLICIFLMINDVAHLFIYQLVCVSVCLLWKTVYSDPLPII